MDSVSNNMSEYRRLALIMVLGLPATVGVLYWRDHRRVEPVAAAATVGAEPAPSPPTTRTPTPAVPAVVTAPPAPVAPPQPVPAAVVAAEPKPAEPRSAPQLQLLTSSSRSAEQRHLRLMYTGDDQPNCEVRVMRYGNMLGSRHLQLRSYDQVELGASDGLSINTGDQLVVQCDTLPEFSRDVS